MLFSEVFGNLKRSSSGICITACNVSFCFLPRLYTLCSRVMRRDLYGNLQPSQSSCSHLTGQSPPEVPLIVRPLQATRAQQGSHQQVAVCPAPSVAGWQKHHHRLIAPVSRQRIAKLGPFPTTQLLPKHVSRPRKQPSFAQLGKPSLNPIALCFSVASVVLCNLVGTPQLSTVLSLPFSRTPTLPSSLALERLLLYDLPCHDRRTTL